MECLFKLYKDSSVYPLTESDKIIARNLVNKFVLEHGAGELMLDFKTKNLLLSEFSRITNKYYNRILEECEDESCDSEKAGKAREFSIDDKTKDDFFGDLENIDTTDASKLIKERVSDAISEFIDNNSFHDRFIILDRSKSYTCGASFKDLGKKCFAISEFNDINYLEQIINTLNIN